MRVNNNIVNELKRDNLRKVNLLKSEKSFNYNLYGLIDELNNIIVNPNFKKEELNEIGYVKEVIKGIYLLFSKEDEIRIVGFYDQKYNKLMKSQNTSYCVLLSRLVLKNATQENLSMAIYDPYRLNYLKKDKVISNKVLETNGVIIFSEIGMFYDTISGVFYENKDYIIKNSDDNYLQLIEKNTNKLISVYDIKSKKIIKCEETFIRNLYIIKGCEEKYIYNLIDDVAKPQIKQFKEFNVLTIPNLKTIIFTNEYEILKEYDQELKIVEIKRCDAIKFGIRVNQNKPIYLINGKLYQFTKRKYPFIVEKDTYPFSFFPYKIIAYYKLNYGIGVIEADCYLELDYLLEQLDLEKEMIETNLERTFIENESLQQDYPKLLKKLNSKK